ncbi:DUF6744 family protein [Streptosporangium sp. CA-115845]|uniref:DUF6744 family protein n=1 Tax=Streptosporangium sp. CA-115845 TaxID=3240071 RepID=UPI003D8C6667
MSIDPQAAPQTAQQGAPQEGGALDTLAAFSNYASLEGGQTPILGHLVLYSIFEGKVTVDMMRRWFLELGLDSAFVPGEIREIDAYERVTGKTGVRVTYSLDGAPAGRRRRAPGDKAREATLMIRHVSREGLRLVRHLVREVRDEGRSRLTYDTRLAEVVFWRDPLDSGKPGKGTLQVIPDHAAITALAPEEQAKVRETLDKIEAEFRYQCTYLTSDRLRTVIRTYVEALQAVRVRATGGVYFVHRAHADTLAALRELTERMGGGSHLARVPLPDQEEMREMVIAAFTAKAKEDLNKLAADIAAAQREGHSDATIAGLHKRFRALQAATAEHSTLLSSSLKETKDALLLVNAQFSNLLSRSG